MKTLIIVSAVLVGVLQYKLWFAGGGVPEVWQLKRSVDRRVAKNIQLREKNAVLEAEVNDLKYGEQAIESRARNDLGMIHKGETFYQISPRRDTQGRS